MRKLVFLAFPLSLVPLFLLPACRDHREDSIPQIAEAASLTQKGDHEGAIRVTC